MARVSKGLVEAGETLDRADALYQRFRLRLLVDARELPASPVYIRSPSDAYQLLRGLAREPREVLVALYLDSTLRLLGLEEIARGSADGLEVRICEIFKGALLTNAHRFLLAHNHPHSEPAPSNRDRDFTTRVYSAAKLLDMECVDHLVIGESGYYSFAGAEKTDASPYELPAPNETVKHR